VINSAIDVEPTAEGRIELEVEESSPPIESHQWASSLVTGESSSKRSTQEKSCIRQNPALCSDRPESKDGPPRGHEVDILSHKTRIPFEVGGMPVAATLQELVDYLVHASGRSGYISNASC
jgi:hypothetical protein